MRFRRIQKYSFEGLDKYFERRDATIKLRKQNPDIRDEPDEPIESLLDACERKWAKGTGQ